MPTAQTQAEQTFYLHYPSQDRLDRQSTIQPQL
jgi:hypothetical protein